MYKIGLILKGVKVFGVTISQIGLCDFYYTYTYYVPDWLSLLPNSICACWRFW